MGLDTLFYRLAVLLISAITVGICGLFIAPVWLRLWISRDVEEETGRFQVSLWVLTAELIANVLFIAGAYVYSDYPQRLFVWLWAICVALSACLTLTAVFDAFLGSTRGTRRYKVASVMLIGFNLLGAMPFLPRH